MGHSIGDRIPDIKVHESLPTNEVSLSELFAGKKVVLFGLPGNIRKEACAFTPGCSNTHLPSHVKLYEKLTTEKGVDMIACISVNDSFVMYAWGKSAGADGKIRMLADFKGDVTRALGLELDCTHNLGSMRCTRFSAVLEDGIIKSINVEPSGGGLTCSLGDNILKQL